MNTVKAWIKAARLRTLPLSVSGILVGTAIAREAGAWDVAIFLLALATTIAFQVTSNYANDYGDGLKGTDNEDRIGPERGFQSGALSKRALKLGITLAALASFILALALIFVAFNDESPGYKVLFILLGMVSIWAAIKYTVGQGAYGYRGLGDIFVFVFFGYVSVVGSLFLYTREVEWVALLPATTIGALSVGVLNLNNMRDFESDKKAGKNTLVVRKGLQWAAAYHHILLLVSFLSMFIYTVMTGGGWRSYLWILAFIPISIHLWNFRKIVHPKYFDPELKKLAISTFILSFLFYCG